MLAFTTLFLGLVLGVQPVTLLPGDEIAAIELRLDDRVLGRRDAPPWTFVVDFGDQLTPREMVAVGFDAEGREIARARQWINLPQSPAEIEVVLETPSEDGSRIARLAWESQAGREPVRVAVEIDGRPLQIGDPRRIVLPPLEADQLHFLRVEMDFGDQVTAVHEMTFGGGAWAGETSGEMTAVLLRSKKPLDDLAQLQGLLLKDGEPLQVLAVEQGPAEVVVVTDLDYRTGFTPILYHIADTKDLDLTKPAGFETLRRRMRGEWALADGDQMRVMWPVAESRAGVSRTFELFPYTPAFTAEDGGLFWILTGLDTAKDLEDGEQRLADAVATAGITAAGRRRRRAVVLLLSEKPRDTGRLSPGQAMHYLERLQVPLHVWQMGKYPDKAGWTRPTWLLGGVAFQGAVRDLRRDLDQQWVVWVEGIHLPQRIELSGKARRLELIR